MKYSALKKKIRNGVFLPVLDVVIQVLLIFFARSPKLYSYRGALFERRGHLAAAATAYAGAVRLDSSDLVAVAAQWRTAYRAGQVAEALDAAVDYIAAAVIDKRQSHFEIIVRMLTVFADPRDNGAYLQKQLAKPADDQRREAALCLLAHFIYAPFMAIRFLERCDPALMPADMLAMIEESKIRLLPSPTEAGQETFVYLGNLDQRLIFDLAGNLDRLSIVIHPSKILSLEKKAWGGDLIRKVTFIPLNAVSDDQAELAEIYVAGKSVAEAITTQLIAAFPAQIGQLIAEYAGSVSLDLSQSLFKKTKAFLNAGKSLRTLQGGRVIVLLSYNDVMFEEAVVARELDGLNVACVKVPLKSPPIAALRKVQIEDADAAVETCPDLIQAILAENAAPLYRLEKPATVVMANYNPEDFRARGVARASLSALLKRTDCVALQRIPLQALPRRRVTDLLREISLEAKQHTLIPCFAFAPPPVLSSRQGQILRGFADSIFAAAYRQDRAAFAAASEFVDPEFLQYSLRAIFEARLPYMLTALTRCDASFADGLTQSVLICVGDRSFEAHAINTSAQKRGVTTFQYNPLFISDDPRYRMPVTDYSIVSESNAADFYVDHYGMDPQKILLAGSHMVDMRRELAAGIDLASARAELGLPAEGRVVTYASQPLQDVSLGALAALIAACAPLDVKLLVKLHPGEVAIVEIYRKLVADAGAADWVTVSTDGDLTRMIVASDLVVTLFSNVGMEAAVLGRNVLTIKLGAEPYPIDLEAQGYAVGAQNTTDLNRIVADLLLGGEAAKLCESRRAGFLSRNPQLTHGKVEERIASIVTSDELVKTAAVH